MPLLNIDILALAEALPEAHRGSFLAMPVSAQLLGIATLSHIGCDVDVRDRAMEALAVLKAPAYVGVDALRGTIQSCASLNKIPATRCEFLTAALSTHAVADAGKHCVGKWYRKVGDRWMLSITARDIAEAVSNLRH